MAGELSDDAPAPSRVALGAATGATHAFALEGKVAAVEPSVRGHINDSYHVRCAGAAAAAPEAAGPAYLLQRINPTVFPDPSQVMENVARVCDHLAAQVRHEYPDSWRRRVLQLVPSRGGTPWHVDAGGHYWRCYHFIGGTDVRSVVSSPAEARRAGAAFAQFVRQMADLPGERLHEVIPSFHDTRRRFDALLAAADDAPPARRQAATEELAFYREREEQVDRLRDAHAAGTLPERVTHNDTKVDNLLLDRRTGEALCVTDLDTTMPGLLAYDYGDLIRTVTSPVPEDHPHAAEVALQLPMFEAVTEGYLFGAAGMMSDAERRSLMWGARLMPMEVGIRFLADYLAGDVYFRTTYPEHNLVRARTQVALLASIESNWARVEAALS